MCELGRLNPVGLVSCSSDATVDRCDREVVVQSGRLVGRGLHECVFAQSTAGGLRRL